MAWHVQHNRALHATILVVNARVESVPWIDPAERIALEPVPPQYWRARVRFGFMEKPDLPVALARGCAAVPGHIGYGTLVGREDGSNVPRWLEAMDAAMDRNAVHFSDFLRLPSGNVVMIGRQIDL